jgi:hypothetical protein
MGVSVQSSIPLASASQNVGANVLLVVVVVLVDEVEVEDPFPDEVVVVEPELLEVVVVLVCPQPRTAMNIKRVKNPSTIFFICISPFFMDGTLFQ